MLKRCPLRNLLYAGGRAEIVDHLPGEHEALRSNPTTARKKKY
jgi:hypothetical protein